MDISNLFIPWMLCSNEKFKELRSSHQAGGMSRGWNIAWQLIFTAALHLHVIHWHIYSHSAFCKVSPLLCTWPRVSFGPYPLTAPQHITIKDTCINISSHFAGCEIIVAFSYINQTRYPKRCAFVLFWSVTWFYHSIALVSPTQPNW